MTVILFCFFFPLVSYYLLNYTQVLFFLPPKKYVYNESTDRKSICNNRLTAYNLLPTKLLPTHTNSYTTYEYINARPSKKYP